MSALDLQPLGESLAECVQAKAIEQRKITRRMNKSVERLETDYDAKLESFQELEKGYNEAKLSFSKLNPSQEREFYRKKAAFKLETRAFQHKRKEWSNYDREYKCKWTGLLKTMCETDEAHDAEIRAIRARFNPPQVACNKKECVYSVTKGPRTP